MIDLSGGRFNPANYPRGTVIQARTRTQDYCDKVVLVAVGPEPGVHGGCFICEGLNPQASTGDWVQAACKAAGLDPEQRICLVWTMDVLGGHLWRGALPLNPHNVPKESANADTATAE